MVLRRVSLAFAVLMLLGLIAACGGGDDDDDSSADTDVAATPTTGAEAQPTTAATEASAEVQLVEPPEMPEGIERNGRMLGNPDAAVRVVEYGDFQ